jgi:hypothetical protein
VDTVELTLPFLCTALHAAVAARSVLTGGTAQLPSVADDSRVLAVNALLSGICIQAADALEGGKFSRY